MRGSSGWGKGWEEFHTPSPNGEVIYDCDKVALHLDEGENNIKSQSTDTIHTKVLHSLSCWTKIKIYTCLGPASWKKKRLGHKNDPSFP